MKNIFIATFIFICISCSENTKVVNISSISENKDIYVVDIDKIVKEDVINMSDYFKSVTTIILETTDDCLIGEIKTLRVLDDFIVITDSKVTESVFIFDKTGKFLQKIGSKGQGPGEYYSIESSSIDFDKKEIYLLDFYDNQIYKYNIETGVFINSVKISAKGISISHLQYIDNKIYSSACPDLKGENSYLLQEVEINTGKQLAAFLKASEYNFGWNDLYDRTEGFFYPNDKGEAKYVQMFMDTIISINKDGIKPYLVIKSKNWITKKDIRDLIESFTKGDSKSTHNILFERNISYCINRYFESGNIIYFQYKNKEENEMPKMEVVIYDKETNMARTSEIFKDDLVYKGYRMLFHDFAYADDKGVYNYIESYQIPSFLNNVLSKGELKLSSDVQERLMELSEDSNPIIFYYERK